METKQKNFYTIGDGSGLTQGIIVASITGIIAARSIISKEKKAKAKLLKYQNSGDTLFGDKFQVVGYSAIAFYT